MIMANINGGYVSIDVTSSDLFNEIGKALLTGKPILIYGDDVPYYADEVTYDSVGNTFDIVKGGQIINVASDGTITKTGDKTPSHLYYVNVYNNISIGDDEFYLNLIFYSEKPITTDNFVEYAKSNNLKLISSWNSDTSTIQDVHFATCDVQFGETVDIGFNDLSSSGSGSQASYSYEDCDFSTAEITSRQLF